MACRTRWVFVVAVSLMLSACQPHRLLGDWVAPASAAAQRPVTDRPAYSTAPDHFVSGWVPYW
ncbi:MAG: hypothetical protein KAY11_20530, partial [Ilumatobacteraceae bacterium]|nr:hypothetical protein [Ilumatobacteraceae bacterium]